MAFFRLYHSSVDYMPVEVGVAKALPLICLQVASCSGCGQVQKMLNFYWFCWASLCFW